MHELSVLADSPELSGYHDFFVPSVFPDDETLRKEADGLLCNILHDYSAFSVSTIDRFFQQTLKSFSREIGQFSSYQVELDKDSLVAESVDRLLDALTEKDADKLQWLTESAVEQIEQGGRYSLESGLMEIASRLKSDEHRTMVEAFGVDEKEAYSRENLLKVRKGCRQIIRDFGISVQDAAGRVLEIVHAAGMKPEDDRLPKRLLEDPIPGGPSKGMTSKIALTLPQYYEARGWVDAFPTEETLRRLGLAE